MVKSNTMNSVRRGIYQHYKGGLYSAEIGARMEGSGIAYVVYRDIKTNKFWIRSKDEFEEILEVETPGKNSLNKPNIMDVPRYSWIRSTKDDPAGSSLFD